MKQKIYYLNDTTAVQSVFVGTFASAPVILQPKGHGAFFEIELPEGGAPFVKSWDGIVLISHMDAGAVQNLQKFGA